MSFMHRVMLVMGMGVAIAAMSATAWAQGVAAPAASNDGGDAGPATRTSVVMSPPYEVYPNTFTALFRIDNLSRTGVDFTAFGVEFGFSGTDSLGGMGFDNGVVLAIGSTDLAGSSSFYSHVMANFGLEIPLVVSDIAFTLDMHARIGLKMLLLENVGSNTLWYLPLEAMIGPRLYFSQNFFIQLEFAVGTWLGLFASNGGTPNSLFSIGLNLGVGLRF